MTSRANQNWPEGTAIEIPEAIDVTSRSTEALKYIRAIRNADKRDYAIRYAIWMVRSEEDKQVVVEPVPFHLSCMAAQAVRMALNTILGSKSIKKN
jgi:hypothetical protein